MMSRISSSGRASIDGFDCLTAPASVAAAAVEVVVAMVLDSFTRSTFRVSGSLAWDGRCLDGDDESKARRRYEKMAFTELDGC